MDGLGLLWALAVEELVPSFPDLRGERYSALSGGSRASGARRWRLCETAWERVRNGYLGSRVRLCETALVDGDTEEGESAKFQALEEHRKHMDTIKGLYG
ncbi:hypothetical protein DM860_000960 [Cuscuta australis]|uniref:Uncharacterized protein n=1 Tax=Cuscuta australis TaxID=267555 RepID=A0A328DTL6_9ASTE|nr:hypothetical protein DM860_000960 [Cuscuta australis]